MEHKVNHELRTTADRGMNKRCRERETEMLTERQIDFNINLWDVCSSGNPGDNSPCAIAIATGRPQWFAVQFIQATLIELSTRTLPRDARTLALRPSQTNIGWENLGKRVQGRTTVARGLQESAEAGSGETWADGISGRPPFSWHLHHFLVAPH